MALRKLPDGTELERLKERYQQGENALALAKEYGFSSRSSFLHAINSLGITRGVPRSFKPRYDNPPVIKDECLITCDEQIPFHDGDFMNRVLEIANLWGIEQGISAGDTLNMTAFAHFIHKPEDTWKEEKAVAMDVFTSMQQAVKKWLMLAGNHTMQLIKALSEQIDMDDLIWILQKPRGFTATDYYYCIVYVSGSKWRITHPRNISVFHARVPQRLCNKYSCNIAAGHGHLVGMLPSEGGQYTAVDIGICADPMRLDYAAVRDTTRPAMNQGALILKKGYDGKCYPNLLTPDVDWEAEKKKYSREI